MHAQKLLCFASIRGSCASSLLRHLLLDPGPIPLFLLELVLVWGSPVAIQIYHYRRLSTSIEHQQTKWIIFGLSCFLLLFLLAIFPSASVPPISVAGALLYLASDTLIALGFLFIPSSITMAILCSWLWEIDVLINHTLFYGLLSAILLVVYLELVFAGQASLSLWIRLAKQRTAGGGIRGEVPADVKERTGTARSDSE